MCISMLALYMLLVITVYIQDKYYSEQEQESQSFVDQEMSNANDRQFGFNNNNNSALKNNFGEKWGKKEESDNEKKKNIIGLFGKNKGLKNLTGKWKLLKEKVMLTKKEKQKLLQSKKEENDEKESVCEKCQEILDYPFELIRRLTCLPAEEEDFH